MFAGTNLLSRSIRNYMTNGKHVALKHLQKEVINVLLQNYRLFSGSNWLGRVCLQSLLSSLLKPVVSLLQQMVLKTIEYIA